MTKQELARKLEQGERDAYKCRVYRQQIRQMQGSIERLKGQLSKLLADADAAGTARFSDERFDKMRWRERAILAEGRLAEAEHLISEYMEEGELEDVGTLSDYRMSRVP